MRASGIVVRNIRAHPKPQPSRVLVILNVDILVLHLRLKFEAVGYGGRPLDRERYGRLKAQLDEIERTR